MERFKSSERKKVIILGGYLSKRSGISRVISDMSWQFGRNAILLSPESDSKFAYSVSNEMQIVKRSRRVPVISWLRDSIDVARFIRRSGEMVVLNSHTAPTAILASAIRLFAGKKRVRVSAWVYDTEAISEPLKRFALSLLLRLGMIDEALVLDNRMAAFVRERLKTERIVVIRIGISPSLMEMSNRSDLSQPKGFQEDGRFVIFFQGVLVPRRRVEDLLLGLGMLDRTELEKVRLCIGGSLDVDPAYTRSIRDRIDRLSQGDRVVLLGDLSEEEMAFMYSRCDTFVFPCDSQTWGLAPLEAMLFSKPAVVSTGAGVTEVLTEDVAIFVPPKNPEAIKNALHSLIANEEVRSRLSKRGREHVLKDLTFASTANHLKALWGMHD